MANFGETALYEKLSSLICEAPGGHRLTGQLITETARDYGISPALVRAVTRIEALGVGFIEGGGLPIIRYERHVFARLTNHRYDGDPYISGPFSIENARPGTLAYDQLKTAAEKDADAAIRATSWGMFQILGNNAELLGYKNLGQFLDDMFLSEEKHLIAFFVFCSKAKRNGVSALEHLQREEFDKFARIYNGPGFRRLGYHTKLERAYNEELAKQRDRLNKPPQFPLPESKPVDIRGSKTKNLKTMPKDERSLLDIILEIFKS